MQPLSQYDPSTLEEKWYQHWKKAGFFRPNPAHNPSFCIVIPPPNVTGSLHMGHAWDCTLQDILTRWHRMLGHQTLWVPGTDHAGIATQWMVEKHLKKTLGKTKEELGRKRFLEEAWRFKESSRETIVKQLSSLGISCDWERERFTLDKTFAHAVRHAFCKLYEKGLVYRGERMISWCPRCLTALSDLEVNHKDLQGKLYHIHYPSAEGGKGLVVATTRPETMFGDMAVAVHPEDEEKASFVGKKLLLPLTDRQVVVLADSYVDQSFGTGALKITPAHDPNDFALAQKHALPLRTIMDEEGLLNQEVPSVFQGLPRLKAREFLVEKLKEEGLLIKEDKHLHSVGHCSRCDMLVEPRVSTQWFIRTKEMAEKAVSAVEKNSIEILPEFQKRIFYEWMGQIQDWCISRQLWWGHRIPAWFCDACKKVLVSEEEEGPTSCTCGSQKLVAEQDVLDTWFSSGLWPLGTLGWPQETEDLKNFYPTSVLVTGYDILFFWVARMAMLGLEFTNTQPFHQVFLHGLLRDAQGEKMSKTKGNGIDPLTMISRHGADALRLSLAVGTVPGKDMSLRESSIVGYRHFVNKLWNFSRFVQRAESHFGRASSFSVEALERFDLWILSRLGEICQQVDQQFKLFRFDQASQALYQFVWHEVCDWYVEFSKPSLGLEEEKEKTKVRLGVFHVLLHHVLRLLHPFIPFSTEELWKVMDMDQKELIQASFPLKGPISHNQKALEETKKVMEVVEHFRILRGLHKIPSKEKLQGVLVFPSAEPLMEEEKETLCSLAGLSGLQLEKSFQSKTGYILGEGPGFSVFLDISQVYDPKEEEKRLKADLKKLEAKIEQLAQRVEDPHFQAKAPAQIIEKKRKELEQYKLQKEKILQNLQNLPL